MTENKCCNDRHAVHIEDLKVESFGQMLSALPITINKHVAITVGEAGQKVKEGIDKHTASTMKSIAGVCDKKTEELSRPKHANLEYKRNPNC